MIWFNVGWRVEVDVNLFLLSNGYPTGYLSTVNKLYDPTLLWHQFRACECNGFGRLPLYSDALCGIMVVIGNNDSGIDISHFRMD